MTSETVFLHSAVHSDTKKHAQIFFEDILGLKQLKGFSLDENLSQKIFAKNDPVDIIVYGNDNMQIEVFIHSSKPEPSYVHLCVLVQDKQQFIDRCIAKGLHPFKVKKGDKFLLFVRDFSNNLYEIKEK